MPDDQDSMPWESEETEEKSKLGFDEDVLEAELEYRCRDGKGPDEDEYDLEERTARFGESVIELARKTPQNSVTRPLITQFVKAGTSTGANYAEADDAESKRDFRHKIALSRKESRETMFWLRMIAKAVPDLQDHCRDLWHEADELNRIFSAIWRNTKVED
jgi:four helix bundle protein